MTWAARIVPACQDLADRLTAAGVRANLDRADLQVPGAWVTPAAVDTTTLSGAAQLRAEVLLVVKAAGDRTSLEALAGLLDKALAVLDPDEDVDTSVVLNINNNALPAFRVVVDLDLEE